MTYSIMAKLEVSEVKIIDIVIIEIDATNIAISFNMGVTDDSSTLQTEFDFTISTYFARSRQHPSNAQFSPSHL